MNPIINVDLDTNEIDLITCLLRKYLEEYPEMTFAKDTIAKLDKAHEEDLKKRHVQEGLEQARQHQFVEGPDLDEDAKRFIDE